MSTNTNPATVTQQQRQKAIKDGLTAYHMAHDVSWFKMSQQTGIQRLDVLVRSSAKLSEKRLVALEKALDVLEKDVSISARKEPETAAATAPKAAEEAIPYVDKAEAQGAEIKKITLDMTIMQAAQDLIFDAFGCDLDEMRIISGSIHKLIAASQLGLEVSLHIEGGRVEL